MKLRNLLVTLCTLLFLTLVVYAQRGESDLDSAPPKDIAIDEVIRRFAAKEAAFKQARDNYTWRQTVKVEELDGDTPNGKFEQESDILFDNQGRRLEHVLYAPQSTLQRLVMSKEDFDDLRSRMPFTITSEEIPQYDIKYVGQQKEDELNTYVFDVKPKQIEKNKRYFDGRIWVDDHDFQIVKTYGKNVPDIVHKKGDENLFPRFTTWREQIDDKYWFPTYTRVDDTLHFSTGDVHLRQIVKYTNYKQFRSNSKITFEGQEVQKDSQDQKPSSKK